MRKQNSTGQAGASTDGSLIANASGEALSSGGGKSTSVASAKDRTVRAARPKPKKRDLEIPPQFYPADPRLQFVYAAATLGLYEVERLMAAVDPEPGGPDAKIVLKRLLTDIKRQLALIPENPDGVDEPGPEVPCCSTCLASYNTCIKQGTPQTTCMTRYNTCIAGCNSSC